MEKILQKSLRCRPEQLPLTYLLLRTNYDRGKYRIEYFAELLKVILLKLSLKYDR